MSLQVFKCWNSDDSTQTYLLMILFCFCQLIILISFKYNSFFPKVVSSRHEYVWQMVFLSLLLLVLYFRFLICQKCFSLTVRKCITFLALDGYNHIIEEFSNTLRSYNRFIIFLKLSQIIFLSIILIIYKWFRYLLGNILADSTIMLFNILKLKI